MTGLTNEDLPPKLLAPPFKETEPTNPTFPMRYHHLRKYMSITESWLSGENYGVYPYVVQSAPWTYDDKEGKSRIHRFAQLYAHDHRSSYSELLDKSIADKP